MSASPEQPKRPQTAYWIWLGENREELTKEVKGKPASEVSKLGGERWKALPEEQKAPYEAKARQQKEDYEKAMEEFKNAGGVPAKRASKKDDKPEKKEKDEDAPKRPAGGAYGCFLAEKRESIKKELPEGHKITDVAKRAGELWKVVSEEEKAKFEKEFQEKMEAYKVAQQEYEKTKGSKRAGLPIDAPTPAKKGRGKAAAKREEPEVQLDAGIQASAEKLGENYVANLKALLGRDDVKAAKKSPEDVLAALKTAGGLLHPARRALGL